MFHILEAKLVAPGIKRFVIEAPRVARRHKPGQFVIVRVHSCGERIPLTIESSDPGRGLISLVVQSVGKTTYMLNSLQAGERLLDLVGPLGRPSEIARFGTVVVLCGGVGAAMAYPTAAALKRAGNRVISILGARRKDLLILEREMRDTSDAVMITTEDGSCGSQGLVTDPLHHLLEAGTHVDLAFAVGPLAMMKAVATMTRPAAIRTIVSLNPIMIDGTGMCGGCRVLVDGKSKFACVDGPEFDGHAVDFDLLMRRNSMYRAAEQAALAQWLQSPPSMAGSSPTPDHECCKEGVSS
ncbi:MAG TPA: sulfide/dihydroorotate dehydrogenase-like FAD/NAD-binding protein [Terriglobales bacterium]|nr:sulfide/dihydroorotate dehydrogenase-like FAD/NAD-binding protein [Terriglobales bacterium]